MSEKNLLSRLGNWFRGGYMDPGNGTTPEFIVNNEDGNVADVTGEPSMSSHVLGGHPGAGGAGNAMEPRSTFLRPWAKRDAAIDQLQGGINAIGELMTGIKDHLEQQSKRQDELLGYLSHLPAAL